MPVLFRGNSGGGRPIRRHKWKWLAALALAAAALAWFLRGQLHAQAFDWKLAAAGFRRLRWHWLILSLAPLAGNYYARALRWAVFLKPLKARPSMRNLFSATVIGFAAITLFGRPGELVRPYLIALKERVPLTSQLAAWLLERIFDLLMVLLLFGFALTRVHASHVQVGPKLAWVLTFGGRIVALTCVALLAAVLSLRHFAEPVRRRLTAAVRFLPEARFRKLETWIAAFIEGAASTRSDGALLLVFLYSILGWASIVAVFWCLAQSFGDVITLTFVDVIIFLGFVSFGAAVQIPGIGGGMQVVAVLVLTELFHVRLELASAFAMLIWIMTFVAVVPVGLGLALKEGMDWRSLRRIGREAKE